VQSPAFSEVLKVPPPQVTHARSVVAEPRRRIEVPGAQTVFGTQSVEGSPSLSHFSPVHAVAGALPPAQYSPLLQGAQALGVVSVPGAVSIVPAGQSAAPRQADWLAPLVYVPGMHVEQIRSVTTDGTFET